MYTRIRQIIRLVGVQARPVPGLWRPEVLRQTAADDPVEGTERPADLTPPPPPAVRRPVRVEL